jgi:hypothetical protein
MISGLVMNETTGMNDSLTITVDGMGKPVTTAGTECINLLMYLVYPVGGKNRLTGNIFEGAEKRFNDITFRYLPE